RDRAGNPEGVEIARFGQALCLYSRTMPWGTFNTVKGITSEERDQLDAIIDFYRQRKRNIQFEIVPSRVDARLLQQLSERGLYPSGYHVSTVIEPRPIAVGRLPESIRVEELKEDQFEAYAKIHCRGTGLPDDGIAPVAANNQVLYRRPGWTFYIAY